MHINLFGWWGDSGGRVEVRSFSLNWFHELSRPPVISKILMAFAVAVPVGNWINFSWSFQETCTIDICSEVCWDPHVLHDRARYYHLSHEHDDSPLTNTPTPTSSSLHLWLEVLHTRNSSDSWMIRNILRLPLHWRTLPSSLWEAGNILCCPDQFELYIVHIFVYVPST
jgi:hypothetical protein